MKAGKILIGIVAAAALGAHIAPVQAGETLCVGLLHEVTATNLRVPRGEVCELEGAEIRGNVTVERHAMLVAQGTHIAGNLQADDADVVSVTARSSVGGNIQIGRTGVVSVIGTRIGGNVQLTRIRHELEVRRNVIGGNLQAFDSDADMTISRNRIHGNLQCSQNSAWPEGHDNRVRGNMEGQCAHL